MKIAYVKWIDSSIQRAQVSPHELTRPVVIETVGVLVARTPEYLSIARDLHDDGDMRDVLHIPLLAVAEMRVGKVKGLKGARKGKRR